MSIFDIVWLIPLTPLVFAGISFLVRRARASAGQLATYGVAISAALASSTLLQTAVAVAEGDPISRSKASIRWFTLDARPFFLGTYIDPVGATLLLILSLTCLLIIVYGKETMRDDSGSHRFFTIASLLVASTLGLVVLDNLLTLFVLWGIIDLCTYLLIGLRREEKPAYEAALRAFLTAGVSNLLLLLGLALLYATTGSLSYDEAFNTAVLQPPVATMIALLLFGGVAGKCAQFPLHVWLHEANEAPAAGSALIHIATTTAGAFLLIRAFPLFEAAAQNLLIADLGITVVTLVGTLTAVFGAVVAVAQRDIRHTQSFFVISQTGYVIAALGMGGYVAGVFHLATSIFVNTLLLLAAGSVTRGMARSQQDNHGDENSDPNDMLNMGGLHSRQPTTFLTFLAGAMALAGLPFVTAGFWSKDAIMTQAWTSNQIVFWLLALTAGLTAFGAMRQLCLIFAGPPRSRIAAGVSESAPAITAPLVVLAIFAIALGWVGIPEALLDGLIPNWFASFVGTQGAAAGFVWDATSLGIAFGVGGLILGFLVYVWKPMQAGEMDRLESAMRVIWLGWFYEWAQNRFYVDRLYRWVFAKGTALLAAAFDGFDDALDSLTDRTAWLGQGLAQLSDWLDAHTLDELVNLTSDAGKLLAQASDRLDDRLDALVTLASRAGKQLARGSGALDLAVDHLANLVQPGTLALANLSDVTDRGLDVVVSSVGSAIRASGLWFRPKTGKTQSYLLLACAAVLVLVAIFTFLFL